MPSRERTHPRYVAALKKFEGTISVDPVHPEKSSVTATIDTTSINTKNDKRDEDLRSEHFFDVAKYPMMTFKSKSVKQTGADSGDIVGDLTMHGVAKEITLHVKFLGKGKGMGGKAISGWQVVLADAAFDHELTEPSGAAELIARKLGAADNVLMAAQGS